MGKRKITYTVTELNKPSSQAVEDFNNTVYSIIVNKEELENTKNTNKIA